MRVNIESQVFAEKSQAEAFKDATYRDYHPLGYGTTLWVKEVPGGYRVTGYRFNSCD